MSITTVGNQLIHYEVLGRGEPLVFLHGWLGSWRYWWPTMQAMSARHRSFAFDLWGFGDSSKESEFYTLEHCEEMLDRFVDQLAIKRPVTIVGHSLGAAVALRFAANNPDKVDKLVGVAMPVEGTQINERLTVSDPDSFITRVIGKSNSFPEIDAETKKTDQLAMNQLAGELTAYDITSDLERCTRPLLTVFGDQDIVVQPPLNGHHLLQQADNNRFYVALNECAHFPMLQDKAKFNRLLLDFFHADDSVTELSPKEHWRRRIR